MVVISSDHQLIEELIIVLKNRLIQIILDANLNVEDLRKLVRKADPNFKTDNAAKNPSKHLESLTSEALIRLFIEGNFRSESDLFKLINEYKHDSSPMFHLFQNRELEHLPSPDTDKFCKAFEESLKLSNSEFEQQKGYIRNVRLVNKPCRDRDWLGWEIKFSYEKMIRRRRPEDALNDFVPDLHFGYV